MTNTVSSTRDVTLAPRAVLAAGILCTGVALLTLSGCTAFKQVPPPPAPAPFVPPAGWSGAAGMPGMAAASDATTARVKLVDWWQHFHDPVLDRLIGQALDANTSVAVARATLLQARATRDTAAAGLGTTVSVSASAQRSKTDGANAANNYAAGFDASWEPDVFGRNGYALAAGEATVRASEVSLADVRVTVAAEVARNYIDLRGAQARLAIARDNVASQEATMQITDWRVQAGLLTSLEQQQALSSTELAKAQLPLMEISVAQLTHSLAVLCGQAPATLDAILAASAPIPEGEADLALSLPADTLRQRPDVRAAEFQVRAAMARVGQADAARYPSFRLEGSIGLHGLGIGGTGSTILRALLGSVSGNAFDGGASVAQLKLEQGALAQSHAAYRATVLAALQDVEDALSALAGDRRRLEHLRSAASAANNAALLARQRYASGLVDFQTVLETQRTLYSAQDSVAATSVSLSDDLVRLYKALGGGWQPDGAVAGSVVLLAPAAPVAASASVAPVAPAAPAAMVAPATSAAPAAPVGPAILAPSATPKAGAARPGANAPASSPNGQNAS
ncbi:efflux transporter outer membrane subunit [Duganella sp. LX20W]|uniref:Efflux transporter outer membrane subunit n=1 Tax=Rugamonas brunnea TaxID=2758569 RepID=A0A7W2IDA1_9BURK|nr:efflux transporter outer membrane subunit [Rugamonas brunnea]MBA5638802.1 efflux transporter outer membrane subunit [Rugamonas brunnea]